MSCRNVSGFGPNSASMSSGQSSWPVTAISRGSFGLVMSTMCTSCTFTSSTTIM